MNERHQLTRAELDALCDTDFDAWLDEVRTQLWEKTQKMTCDERTTFLHNRAKQTMLNAGLDANFITLPVFKRGQSTA